MAEPQLASASHLSTGSPCRGAGSRAYSSGVDIDGEPWANPPSIGCDEYEVGAVTGPLTVAIQANYTNITAGIEVDFRAQIGGRVSASRWEYGDGTVVSNQPYTLHSWATVGDYSVILWAYNETYPEGLSATVNVHVIEPPIHYVAQSSSSPVAPYLTWATAARNIQDAADAAAVPGSLVLVSNGVYQTGGREVYGSNRLAVTKPLTVRSVNGPEMTVIKGGGGVRCVYLTNGAALVGFALTNGVADVGGGVRCGSNAVVSNCTLTGNSAANEGGGAYGGTLQNCMLSRNSAPLGGGVYSNLLNNCTLIANSARSGGGAASSGLNNCVLTRNLATNEGGGAYNCTLNNATLTGNSARTGGGVSGGTLNNCIAYYNTATISNANSGRHNQLLLCHPTTDKRRG